MFGFEDDDDAVPEGEDAEEAPEGEEVVEDARKGFVSEDNEAADRSNVNWRMSSGPCWLIVNVSLVESRALPWFQAQIQGEESDVALDSRVHVVPI